MCPTGHVTHGVTRPVKMEHYDWTREEREYYLTSQREKWKTFVDSTVGKLAQLQCRKIKNYLIA